MHPFLLLLGTAAVTYSQMLGHTWIAGVVAVIGGLLQALAKRAKIPMMRSLPTFAPAGSGPAIALSLLFLVAGAVLIAIPIAATTQFGIAARIFFPVLGSGALMMFDSADLVGVTTPTSAAALLAALMLPFACAHVQPVTNCVEGQLGNQGPVIIAEVEADLAARNLEDLALVAGRIGWVTLGCILDDLEAKGKLTPVQLDTSRKFKTENRAKLHA